MMDIQAEQLRWHRAISLAPQCRPTADKRLQPVPVAPDQQAGACNQRAPQQYFQQRGQCAKTLAIEQPEQGRQPARCLAVVSGFAAWRLVTKTIAGDRLLVLERRLIEDFLDAVP